MTWRGTFGNLILAPMQSDGRKWVMPKKVQTAYVLAARPMSLAGSPEDSAYGHDGKPTKDYLKWALFYTGPSAIAWAKENGIEMTDAHGYIHSITPRPGQEYANLLD